MTGRWWSCLLLVLVLPVDAVTQDNTTEAGYPNRKLLIEPAELASSLKEWIVLDVRKRAAYEAGHVPGAVHVDHDEWAKAFKPDPPAAEWGKRIGGIGIDGRRPVVVYDDESGKSAARIWWLLRYWGVEDARLLNGFWHGWKAGGHPIDTNVTKPAPVRFQAKAQKDRLATKRELEAAVATGKDKLQILDARSQPEFTGLLKLTNRRGGHVPGARHLEWSVFLDPKTQRFKPAPEIEQMLVSAGITAEGRCVTYCQSGGRASVAAFVLELMGRRDTANYYESWNDWGNDPATPVEKAR